MPSPVRRFSRHRYLVALLLAATLTACGASASTCALVKAGVAAACTLIGAIPVAGGFLAVLCDDIARDVEADAAATPDAGAAALAPAHAYAASAFTLQCRGGAPVQLATVVPGRPPGEMACPEVLPHAQRRALARMGAAHPETSAGPVR